MWRRGADLDGNVANFVESEQILEYEGYFASYTQVLVTHTRHVIEFLNFELRKASNSQIWYDHVLLVAFIYSRRLRYLLIKIFFMV